MIKDAETAWKEKGNVRNWLKDPTKEGLKVDESYVPSVVGESLKVGIIRCHVENCMKIFVT